MPVEMTQEERARWLASIRSDAANVDDTPWKPGTVPFLLSEVDRLKAERDALLDCRPVRERDEARAQVAQLREALKYLLDRPMFDEPRANGVASLAATEVKP